MNEEKQALLGVALARLNAIKFDLHHKHSNVQVSFLNKNTWESADYLEGVFECEVSILLYTLQCYFVVSGQQPVSLCPHSLDSCLLLVPSTQQHLGVPRTSF